MSQNNVETEADVNNIAYSLLPTISDVTCEPVFESFEDIARRMQPVLADKKSSVPLFSGVSFKGGRRKEHATGTQILVFDFDNADPAKAKVTPEQVCALLEQRSLKFVVASSFNHTPDHPRFRAMVFLGDGLLPHQHEVGYSEALVQLGFSDPAICAGLDGTSANITQFFYLPSYPAGGTPFYRVCDGEWFYLDASSSHQYAPLQTSRGSVSAKDKAARARQYTSDQVATYWLSMLPQLSDHGREWKCACPIHGGENPKNFSVAKDSGFWFCFSECQSKGLRGGGLVHFHFLLRNKQLPADKQLTYQQAAQEVTQMIGLPAAMTAQHFHQMVTISTREQIPDLLSAAGRLSGEEKQEAIRALTVKHAIEPAVIAEYVVPRTSIESAQAQETLGGTLNFYLSSNDSRAQRIWDTYRMHLDTDTYDIDERGVYRLKHLGTGDKARVERQKICAQPVWITQKVVDPASASVWVSVSWHAASGVVCSKWVQSKDLRYGAFKEWPDFPGDAARAANLAEYFAEAIELAPHDDTLHLVHDLGWQFSGDRPELVLYPDEAQAKDKSAIYLAAGRFSVAGELKVWRELFEWMNTQPFDDLKMFWAMLGMSAAAPLVRHLKIRNPIMVLATSSSKGKSVVAAAAQSIWNNWLFSQAGASSTVRATEDMVTLHQDVAYMIDEFQRHIKGGDFRGAEDLIYNLGNGLRRHKIDMRAGGKVVGGEIRYGPILMTSEDDFFSQLAEGARNRCLVLRGTPLPSTKASDFVKRVYDHYGVVGKELEQYYNNNLIHMLPMLRSRIKQFNKYQENNNVQSIGDDVPAIALAVQGLAVLQTVFNIKMPTGLLARYLLSVLHPQRETSATEPFDKVTRCFLDLMSRLPNIAWGSGGNQDYAVANDGGTIAVRGSALMDPDNAVYEVLFGSQMLSETLRTHNLKDAVFGEWLRRGFLVRNNTRKNAFHKHARTNVQGKQGFQYEGATVFMISKFGVDVAAGNADPNTYMADSGGTPAAQRA